MQRGGETERRGNFVWTSRIRSKMTNQKKTSKFQHFEPANGEYSLVTACLKGRGVLVSSSQVQGRRGEQQRRHGEGAARVCRGSRQRDVEGVGQQRSLNSRLPARQPPVLLSERLKEQKRSTGDVIISFPEGKKKNDDGHGTRTSPQSLGGEKGAGESEKKKRGKQKHPQVSSAKERTSERIHRR